MILELLLGPKSGVILPIYLALSQIGGHLCLPQGVLEKLRLCFCPLGSKKFKSVFSPTVTPDCIALLLVTIPSLSNYQ